LVLSDEVRERLLGVLEEGQRRGLLGPGPVDAHVDHALAFGDAVQLRGGDRVRGLRERAVDLGTGGGLPGLVLAVAWPESRWLLVDSRQRSTDFVAEAVARLDVGDRVTVLQGRAEEVGRDPAYRGRHRLVTARGFGPPAATAECGAPLLEPGGQLVVSEPPGSTGERWPEEPLAQLGLRLTSTRGPDRATVAVLEQVAACPDRFPRRAGVPAKRPLFGPKAAG
jgi:16S rRNA (guanine527-N7)-methyltransferase